MEKRPAIDPDLDARTPLNREATAYNRRHEPDDAASPNAAAEKAHPSGAELSHHEAGEHRTHERSQQRSDHGGHTDHTGHEQLFRNRFWISLLLTLPVLLYNPMIQAWFNFTMPVFPGSQWISPALSTVIFVIGGLPFLQMAAPELRKRQPGYRKMVQNLAWATGYNAVALPLAAGILAPFGVLLSPAAGAILMSLSTVIVAVNAQLLRRYQL